MNLIEFLTKWNWKGLNLLENIEKTIKESHRMEMIGAGLYKGLARQYRKKDKTLSQTFLKFSNQEAMHGHLFRMYSKKTFDRQPGHGFFWKSVGQVIAFLMTFVSLDKKLKKLHAAEQDAVTRIQLILKEDIDPGYQKILETILPHEREHANLYSNVMRA